MRNRASGDGGSFVESIVERQVKWAISDSPILITGGIYQATPFSNSSAMNPIPMLKWVMPGARS